MYTAAIPHRLCQVYVVHCAPSVMVRLVLQIRRRKLRRMLRLRRSGRAALPVEMPWVWRPVVLGGRRMPGRLRSLSGAAAWRCRFEVLAEPARRHRHAPLRDRGLGQGPCAHSPGRVRVGMAMGLRGNLSGLSKTRNHTLTVPCRPGPRPSPPVCLYALCVLVDYCA
jgi:hypothetical protein